ncbi:MAG: choice-of-anchor D domain-containing protein [Terriglobales bacterium]
MKLTKMKWMMLAAIVALAVTAASPIAWAQGCPTSPTYSPDFTSNQSCLTPNGSAGFPTPGAAATITGWSGSGGFVTFTASNSFVADEPIILSGFANSTFFNGLAFPVLAGGLSSTQFEVAFSGYSGSSDTGVATPANVLQLTPNQTGQAGSAWYNTQQPVTAPFSTTFTFQLSDPSTYTADGIAFVIQNSTAGTGALGNGGCSMGFAEDLTGACAPATGGITNSVAVAFKTYDNGSNYPGPNSVSIESNGTGANCIDLSPCTIAVNGSLPGGIYLADGNIHAVTVAYTLQPTAAQTNCLGEDNVPLPCLDVILDGNDLFPAGVQFDMSTIGPTEANTAWVGFTGGTGGGDDNQDILSWVFSQQGQSQTQPIMTGTTTDFNYNGGFTPDNPNSGYNYNAILNSGNPVDAVTTAIPITNQATCDAIVNKNPNFSGAHCFVYANVGGPNIDQPVMFELTCPPSGPCASNGNPFDATLGTEFAFNFPENLPEPDFSNSFNYTTPFPMGTTLPGVGFLRGEGPDSVHPCTPYPNNDPPLFQSNQISSFAFNPDTSGGAKGGSGGVNSCWLATYNTPNEMPTASITSPANGGVYVQGSNQASSYSCAAVNNSNVNGGVNGPYLTVTTCSGPVPSGTAFDTSTPGPHSFTVNVEDSALNVNSATANYTVVADVPPAFTSANSATFTIGVSGSFMVTTSGVPAPSIKETGNLPNGLTFVDNGNGTGTLRGTPMVLVGGDFGITFTAQNGINPSAMQAFTIVLQQAPSITSANKATFAYGVPNSFTVTTTGFPAPSISKSGTLPPGVTFVDHGNGTGSLSGTPSVGGTFPLVLSATNVVTTAQQNFTLTVGGLNVSPSPLDFRTVNLNTSHTASVTLTNVGTSAVTVSGASITPGTANAAAYTFANHCGTPLKTGKSCTIAVTFLANAVGTLTATLNITDNAVGSPQHVSLTGTVIDPVAQFNPARLGFETVPVNTSVTLPVQLTNTGQTTLIISGIAIVGANSGEFSQVNNCPATLSATLSCTISVTFAPTVKGARTGTLTITDNVAAGQSTVSLTGTGR